MLFCMNWTYYSALLRWVVMKGRIEAHEAEIRPFDTVPETAGFEPADEYQSSMPCKGTPLGHSGTSPRDKPCWVGLASCPAGP